MGSDWSIFSRHPSCCGEAMGPYCLLPFFFPSPLCLAERGQLTMGLPSPGLSSHSCAFEVRENEKEEAQWHPYITPCAHVPLSLRQDREIQLLNNTQCFSFLSIFTFPPSVHLTQTNTHINTYRRFKVSPPNLHIFGANLQEFAWA